MFSSIQDIEHYLLKLIPDSSKLRFPGNDGIIRTKEFLRLLGSPQNKLKVIHVAGTSGKGSTSFMVSNMLATHGFKVGLSLSPHLLDIRERLEINNSLISLNKCITYFNAIKPAIEQMEATQYGKITYFEAMVGMTYYVFSQEKVDYAVIETGLGGQFDGTNVIDREDKLSVLSKVGFDHMKILGNSLSEIAHQKALICSKKGDLISIYQYPSVVKEIKKVIDQKKGNLYMVEKNSTSNIKLSQENTTFTFMWNSFRFKNLTLGLLGAHQVQNASLALATVCHLSKREGFPIDQDRIMLMLRTIRFKGRFDIIKRKGNKVILDGAHNVPKMKALLKTLKSLFPETQFTFIIAFKKGKEYKKMIELIIPYAKKILITHIFSESQDLQHFSVEPSDILNLIIQSGFSSVSIVNNMKDIIKLMDEKDTTYVVSGSLYLLGDIYTALEK